MWSFAKLEMRHQALVQHVSSRSLETLGEFNAQDLTNTVWAFAKLV